MAGNRQQTSSTTSEPWAPAQGTLQRSLQGANDLYSAGVGSQPYMGSTTVPQSAQTQTGLGWMQSGAQSAMSPMQRQFQMVANNAGNGGFNPIQDEAVAGLRGAAANGSGSGALNDIQRNSLAGYQSLAGTGPAAEGTGQLNDIQRRSYDLLNPIAGGSEMNGNPYLDDVISRSSRDMQDSINLSASGAGRYGSGAHQGVLSREIGDMSSGLRYQDFNNQQGRRDAAIRDVFGMGETADRMYESDMGRRQAGLAGMTGLGAAGEGQYRDALSSLFNAGQTHQQNINGNNSALQSAYGGMMQPGQTMMDVGGQYEDLYGRNLNDTLRIFQGQQDAPWNQLARLNAIGSGAGALGGSGTATAQGPSRLSGGVGGAIAGSSFGPLGMLGGGLLGLLG